MGLACLGDDHWVGPLRAAIETDPLARSLNAKRSDMVMPAQLGTVYTRCGSGTSGPGACRRDVQNAQRRGQGASLPRFAGLGNPIRRKKPSR
jgi:hypothetical protein